MAWRVSFIYKRAGGGRPGGWSENFWYGTATAAVVIQKAVALSDSLNRMHGHQSVLQYIRCSEEGTRRVQVLETNYATNPGVPSGDDTNMDNPTTALLLVLRSGLEDEPFAISRQWIKGTQDDIVKDGGLYRPNGPFAAAWQTFVGILTSAADAWQIRILDPARPTAEVSLVSPLGNFVTGGPHGFVPGQLVDIQGRGLPPYIRRRWRVRAVPSAVSFDVANWDPPKSFVVWDGFAEARPVLYTAREIGAAEITRISKRNIGRPFGAPAGRANARR